MRLLNRFVMASACLAFAFALDCQAQRPERPEGAQRGPGQGEREQGERGPGRGDRGPGERGGPGGPGGQRGPGGPVVDLVDRHET